MVALVLVINIVYEQLSLKPHKPEPNKAASPAKLRDDKVASFVKLR